MKIIPVDNDDNTEERAKIPQSLSTLKQETAGQLLKPIVATHTVTK
jgi:hypothetical protein